MGTIVGDERGRRPLESFGTRRRGRQEIFRSLDGISSGEASRVFRERAEIQESCRRRGREKPRSILHGERRKEALWPFSSPLLSSLLDYSLYGSPPDLLRIG